MAQTRLRLNQIESSGLIIRDVTRSYSIEIPNDYTNYSQFVDETIGLIDTHVEPIELKFRVFDIDDSLIGESNTFEEAEKLFLELHPHFHRESVKTFIYEI